MMWLLGIFFLATFFSCGSAQGLQQTPISITKPEGENVQISCRVSSPDFINVFVHWYQKKGNAPPKRVAYISSTFFLENRSDEGKFSVAKDPSKSVCTLTVSKVTPQDSATYYCAIWDTQQQKATGDLHKDMPCFPDKSLNTQEHCHTTFPKSFESGCTASQIQKMLLSFADAHYSQYQQTSKPANPSSVIFVAQ